MKTKYLYTIVENAYEYDEIDCVGYWTGYSFNPRYVFKTEALANVKIDILTCLYLQKEGIPASHAFCNYNNQDLPEGALEYLVNNLDSSYYEVREGTIVEVKPLPHLPKDELLKLCKAIGFSVYTILPLEYIDK